jgi:uncharacterized membrane-anchored protein YhcB (DUF1043 family)
MLLRIKTCSRLSPVFLLCLCVLTVRAQQERPPFELVGTGDFFTLAAGEDNKVQILNNTARPLNLTVKLVDGQAKGDLPLSPFLDFEPKTLQLFPASDGTIVLRLKSTESSKPGSTLSTHLVVYDDSSNMVKRRLLKFNVPGKTESPDKPVALTSLVNNLKTTVYYWPTDREIKDTNILAVPLDAKITKEIIDGSFRDDKKTIARLANESGQTALVSYRQGKEESPGSAAGIVLDFKSTGGAGEYKGNLLGVTANEGKPVSLTVITTTYWLFPVLALLAGIVIYYLMQWYLNVLRKVWGLQEQEAELEGSFARAEAHFAETTKGKDYATDSIRPDFRKQTADLLTAINKLKFKNLILLDENSSEYKAVVENLSKLRDVVKKWSSFAETKLNALSDALAAASPSFKTRPPDPTLADKQMPEVASQAVEALKARLNPMSVEQFTERLVKTDELLPRLSSWNRLNSMAETVWQRYETLVGAPEFAKMELLDRDEVNTQRKQSMTIWRTLWTRESFDIKTLGNDLFTLEDALASHARATPATRNASIKTSSTVTRDAAGGMIDRYVSPAERIMLIGQRRLWLDLFYFGLAVVVAVYSGLTLLYFNKPFGTALNYLDAFFWGLGTKATLDLLTGAINKFTSRGA